MLSRSIAKEEKSVLDVLGKQQRLDVLGFKKELPKTGQDIGSVSGGGVGETTKPGTTEERDSQTDGAACKA